MSLFHHIHLPTIDPLGGGLAEEIIAEQESPEVISLEDGSDGETLIEKWSEITDNLKSDPDWIDFSED